MSEVNLESVLKWVANTADMDDMNLVSEMMRRRRTVLGVQAGLSLKPGDRVYFDAKTRGIVRGVFLKQNQKNAKVQADSGAVWTVSPNLLHKEEAK